MYSDYAVVINFPYYKRGDEWPGIANIGPITIDGQPPTLPLTRIRCHFVHTSKPGVVYRLDSDPSQNPDAPIIIDNATIWQAHVDPIYTGFLPVSGQWAYDMEFYRSARAVPLTFYKGTIEVGTDITRNITAP